MIPGKDIAYPESVCDISSGNIGLLGLILNIVVLINMLRLAITGRNIPNRFNEGKLMGVFYLFDCRPSLTPLPLSWSLFFQPWPLFKKLMLVMCY
jgi:hypothetical protein